MDFQVGVYVKFIDDIGGGRITKVINSDTVLIELEDGFDVEAKIRSLVIDPDKTKLSIPKKITSQQVNEPVNEVKTTVTSKSIDLPLDTNIEVHFVKSIHSFDLVIRNEQDYSIKAFFFTNQELGIQLIHEVEVPMNSYKEIGEFEPGKWSNLLVEIVWLSGNSKFKHRPISKNIKIKTARFFKNNSFKHCDWLGEKTISEVIYEDESLIDKINTENHALFKESTQKGPRYSKSHNRSNQIELDIHIDELVDDHRFMTNGEIVEVQLDAVRQKIEFCIQNRISELVIIHGRGKGKLRDEVRQLAKSYKLDYSDGSFQKYGAGATLIEFK